MHRLILLGGVHLESHPGSRVRRCVQARPLALLAVLARSPGIPLTREKAARLLWPDVPMRRARKRLSDLVYMHRTELGSGAILSVADRLRLDPGLVDSDAAAFERALEEGGPEAAAGRYTGPFMDGFVLRGNRPFDAWLEGERRTLATRYRDALESAAEDAERQGDWNRSVRWWRRLATEVPADSRVALRLMEALARGGAAAEAIEHGRAHERHLRVVLELPAPRAVRAFADTLGDETA